MAEKIINRLVSVKSIVTLTLTAVFAYLSITGIVTSEQFLTIFTVVIGFYFGTQYEKKAAAAAVEAAEQAAGANDGNG